MLCKHRAIFKTENCDQHVFLQSERDYVIMETYNKGRTITKLKEPKELLVFFPEDYSTVKVSRNKVLGTIQQLSGLKENTWVHVDIGEPEPWKGLIIKTGKSRNELGRCELSFLDFLNRYAANKENIPLDKFFLELQDDDSSEEESLLEMEEKLKEPIKTANTKKKPLACSQIERKSPKTPKTKKRPLFSSDDPVIIQNKKEKKLKKEEVIVQAVASKKLSDEILEKINGLKDCIKENSDSEIEELECDPDNLDKKRKQIAVPSEFFLDKLQEMFGTAMKGLHDRFDVLEKAVSTMAEKQEATEKKLSELTAKLSRKPKVSRPLSLVVDHSPLACNAMIATTTPERQKPMAAVENKDAALADIELTKKDGTDYVGKTIYGVTASSVSIRRAEEQCKSVPKCLAFNLLNLFWVDIKVQGESNISGQNGKKPLDKNIMNAIKSHLCTYFDWGDSVQAEDNWRREPMNIQQRIADKCRNLNKKKYI